MIAGLSAQIVSLQYRYVPDDHVEEFLHRETTYWSKVAAKAMADGKMLNWELWERVGGWNMDKDASNFVFVNVYEKASDMDNLNSIWSSVSELFPDARMSDMETNSMSRVKSSIILRGHGNLGRTGNFAVVNYTMVSDIPKYLEFETQKWQPFLQKAMEDGKTNFVGWGVLTLAFPRGSAIPFNAMSVDHFESMSDAMSVSVDGTMPDFAGYGDITDRKYIGIYRLVASANN